MKILKKLTKSNKKQTQSFVESTFDKKVVHFSAVNTKESVLKKFGTTLENGLIDNDIENSKLKYGENDISSRKKKSLGKKLAEAFINPFTAILFCLVIVSSIVDIIIPLMNSEEADYTTVIIILTMVTISGILRFVQEYKSGNEVEKLYSMITTTCTVTRNGNGSVEIPFADVVVGDIVNISVGDMIPADMRIIEAKDLFISQSALTGESDPVEKKSDDINEEYDSITDLSNIAFMGSNVVSGTAKGVVISVERKTMFGAIASEISSSSQVQTSFSKGVNSVSWLLIRFMMVMVPVIFFINGFTKGNWVQAFLFAISVAVGLTPEMLPMIVTTSLAKGAVSMSKKKTIIKKLDSIQNFGAIDILCTDKTGTITQDKVVLLYHLDVHGKDDLRVLRHAYLNSYFQTGYKNLLDLAVISKTEELEDKDSSLVDLSNEYEKIDEIPFDFKRRRLSTVVSDKKGKTQMITKGAVEEMLSICSYVEFNNEVCLITDELKDEVLKITKDLNKKGMRVVVVAQKTNPSPVGQFSVLDECDMVLLGFLAFLDPLKESTKNTIKTLREYGVRTKILTGDNEVVTKYICKQVGLNVSKVLLGNEIDALSDHELAYESEKTDVFAKLSPDQKSRVVSVLRNNGHVVGFMGDGINDCGAMKSADIGISVDTAVDVAKESADIILLEKDLMILEEGIVEGRKTYANMIKYIKMTASSNFGNVFSVLIASALIPFLPMMSIHLILLNLICDICCVAIPWDNVDEEFLKKPRKWDASSIGKFMIWFGPTSSIFDWLTYAFLYFVLCPMFISKGILYSDLNANFNGVNLESMKYMYTSLFQAGWFVESMWSQTLVIHMIRTKKLPFIQSRASLKVTLLSVTGILIVTMIPYTYIGKILGFQPLPMLYYLYLVPIILIYMILATLVKKLYIKKHGELL